MTAREPFVFGVPLIARAAAGDWALVDRLFALTLRSVLAQTDRDFRVVVAGHDRPPCWGALVAGDARFGFVEADWTPAAPTLANDDGGAKKALIHARVLADGRGLLMFLHADDWVDRDLVRAARAAIGPAQIGAIIARGWAYDWRTGRAARFPVAGGFDGAFHALCGSSTLARIDPTSDDPVRRDPHAALGWHAGWDRVARELGLDLAMLDVEGVYLVGTERSHSECQGPYANWRRGFAQAVRDAGRPFAAAEWARFGLDPRAAPSPVQPTRNASSAAANAAG